MTCYDAATGERVYRARIGGVGGSYAASPVAAECKIYFTSEGGKVSVVKQGAEWEVIFVNDLKDGIFATQSISD